MNQQVDPVLSTLADLASSGSVVVDGGMGTLLQDKGQRAAPSSPFGGTGPRLDMDGLCDRALA